ncbi:hypothetical protein MTR67_012625 [Solanum verrucosum]|uniref:Uncharacterized protein n=1 Tax=Solanum verrucosum TaxID=315347 RepID=A0AAF0TN21_SOLVR|nr:hypothetical protein MTR67_012625 [Solanum verrucosum]
MKRVAREETWEEFGAGRGLFSGPWVLCGDFNTSRLPSEKKSCLRINIRVHRRHGSDGPRVEGGKYTWKKLVSTQLTWLEEIKEHRTLQEEEIVSRMTLINEFEDTAKKEESLETEV